MSYLPWYGTFVYHDLRGPLTLTPVAKHLAAELSLSLFNDLRLWRPGFKPWYSASEVNSLATEPPFGQMQKIDGICFIHDKPVINCFKRNMYVFLIDFHSPSFNIRDIMCVMNFRFYGLIACYPILKCVSSLKFYTFYQLYSSSNFPLISFWKHFSCGWNSIISSFQHTYTCILLYWQFSD